MVIYLKKIKFLTIFITFLFSFLFHFGYNLSDNILFSIIFPVNESIWEHMKIIATSVIMGSIIEYFLLTKNNVKFNNYTISTIISIILGIVIYLVIYLPIHYLFGHSLIVAVTILSITFIIIENIKYFIMRIDNIKYQNAIGLILIILLYFIFGYLTYNPIQIDLFMDPECECYGIEK